MYKLRKDEKDQVFSCVVDTQNNIAIPFDPANTDYQAYLAWIAEGNTPQPAEEGN